MNILIVSANYAPELGAAPSRLHNMARGLHRKGNEVEILTAMPNYPKGRIFDGYRGRFSLHETLDGMRIHRYWTFATVSKKPLQRMLNMLAFSLMIWCFIVHFRRIMRYDCVVIQTPHLPVAASAMALFGGLFRKKTVLNVSDIWPLTAVELGAMKEGSAYYKVLAALEGYLYRYATAIQGQSQEILNDARQKVGDAKPLFLYRNLQPLMPEAPDLDRPRSRPLRIVYAGLLGVAQNVLSIIEHIDFKKAGVELHLFGGGNQVEAIEAYIQAHDCNVVYHGYLPKEKMRGELETFDAALVPLVRRIHGAVPSKIFDLMPVAVPILLCCEGEVADIVRKYGVGMVSTPGNLQELQANIERLQRMSDSEYRELRAHCLAAAQGDFSFDKQLTAYQAFMTHVVGAK